MKRAMIMGVRKTTNKNTNDNVVYVTIFILGNRSKKGDVYLPKPDDAVKIAYANQTTNLEKYDKYVSLAVGSICDVTLGVSDFNGDVFVSDLKVVLESPYTLDDLYGTIKN